MRSIAGGRSLLARTLALGLVPGTPVLLLRAFGGPVIIAVRGSRLALGRAMARRVWVEPLPAEPSRAFEPAGRESGAAAATRVAPMGAGSAP